jgi:hypothetical protein
MSKRANITRAEIRRMIRAAQEAGALEIRIELGNARVTIPLAPGQSEIPSSWDDAVAKLETGS